MKNNDFASILDNPDACQQFDPSGMMELVKDFARHCTEGVDAARHVTLPNCLTIMQFAICGMGGSAMGGDLLRVYAERFSRNPIQVIRSYQLPAYIDESTLVISSSFSGNTEETLAAYNEAKRRGSQIVGLTSGGELQRRCDRDGYPCVLLPDGMPPRAALGYSFFAMVKIFERLEIAPNQAQSYKAVDRVLRQCAEQYGPEVPTEENPAKRLAARLYGKIPVMYAGEPLMAPVALRWRTQINENAKTFAHDLSIPEMNHNEILAWKNPSAALSDFHVIYLMDNNYPGKIKDRFEVMRPIIVEAADGVSEAWALGEDPLARMVSLIHLGDYVSVYLAYLYQEDPVTIPAIDLLKSELAKR